MRRTALPPTIQIVHARDVALRLDRFLTIHRAGQQLGIPGAEALALFEANNLEIIELRGPRGTKARRLVREDDVIELLRTSRKRTAVEAEKRLDLALDLALAETGAIPTRRRRV